MPAEIKMTCDRCGVSETYHICYNDDAAAAMEKRMYKEWEGTENPRAILCRKCFDSHKNP